MLYRIGSVSCGTILCYPLAMLGNKLPRNS
jgi:hypothetical protein